jgi:hypothetical protein
MQTAVKTVTKQDFINELRTGKYEQLCDGRMFDLEGRVCAMMVWHILNGDKALDARLGDQAGTFGMPHKVYDRITQLNDSKHGFHIIADLLEQFLSDDLQELNY